MALGELIRSARKAKRISLADASKELRISVSYLCDIEKGRRTKVKMDFLYLTADFYGITIDDICAAAGRIPKDIFYFISKNPHLFAVIRNLEA